MVVDRITYLIMLKWPIVVSQPFKKMMVRNGLSWMIADNKHGEWWLRMACYGWYWLMMVDHVWSLLGRPGVWHVQGRICTKVACSQFTVCRRLICFSQQAVLSQFQVKNASFLWSWHSNYICSNVVPNSTVTDHLKLDPWVIRVFPSRTRHNDDQ